MSLRADQLTTEELKEMLQMDLQTQKAVSNELADQIRAMAQRYAYICMYIPRFVNLMNVHVLEC